MDIVRVIEQAKANAVNVMTMMDAEEDEEFELGIVVVIEEDRLRLRNAEVVHEDKAQTVVEAIAKIEVKSGEKILGAEIAETRGNGDDDVANRIGEMNKGDG